MYDLVIIDNPPADKEYRKINETRKRNIKNIKHISEPFKCTKCRRVWQYRARNDSDLSGAPQYLDNFPSYGCTECICVLCKK